MKTIAAALIQELKNSGGQCTGIGDLIDRIPGDRPKKLIIIRELEEEDILVRSKDNRKGGRGHKRTVKLLRES
jgi:hypothetical protein